MDAKEMVEIDGGRGPKGGGLWGLLFAWVDENWADLKSGAISGWNDCDKKYPNK